MPKQAPSAEELIRQVIDGKGASAKRKLARLGEAAVEPILATATGGLGAVPADRAGDVVNELVKVLITIAKDDAKAVAGALAHEVPGVNLVHWALGHSTSRHAQSVMKQEALEHEDGAIRDVAEFHLNREGEGRRSPTKKKRASSKAKKASKKPVARKKRAKKKGTRK